MALFIFIIVSLVIDFTYVRAFLEAKTGYAVSFNQDDDCRIDNLNALISESNATGRAVLMKFGDESYHPITVNQNSLTIDKNGIIKENVIFNENKNIVISNKKYNKPVILAIIDIKNFKIINKTILNKNNLNEDGINYVKYFLRFKE